MERRGFLGRLLGVLAAPLALVAAKPRALRFEVDQNPPSRERYAAISSLRHQQALRASLYDSNKQWLLRTGGSDENPIWGRSDAG